MNLLRPKMCSHHLFKRTGWRQLGAILLLTLFCVVPAAAQGQNAVVRPDPLVAEVAVAQTATVQFMLADAQNAYGIDLRATFDPQLVEVVDADPGADGVQMTPGDFLRPDFVVRNVADNEQGTLRYALTQVNPTEPASGAGVIFTVQFRGKAAGESALTLGPVELADRQGQLLPVTVQSGTIKVVATQAPTPVLPATSRRPPRSRRPPQWTFPLLCRLRLSNPPPPRAAGRTAMRRLYVAARRRVAGSGGVGCTAPHPEVSRGW